MDIGRTFSYVTEDERWVSKVLIGGLVTIIPIVGQLAVMGYMFKVAQNVARGSERPLPEWGEFGDLIMRGLYGLVISLVYFIPYIVLAILFSCVTGGLGAAAENSDSAGSIAGGLACLFVPLMLIFALGGAILAWGGYARYIATGQLSEAFKFGEVVAVIRNNVNLWLMMLVVGLLSGVVASLGLIACGVGVLFTSFYAYLMQGHALGQVVAQIYPSGGSVTDPPASYTPPTVQL